MSSPVKKAQHDVTTSTKHKLGQSSRMSSIQQRKNEILAKKAKLAELKKQRELRQKEFTNTRNSVGDASEVNTRTPWSYYSFDGISNSAFIDRFSSPQSL